MLQQNPTPKQEKKNATNGIFEPFDERKETSRKPAF